MPDVAFVMSPRQPYPLRELTETLRYELDRQGISSSVSSDGFPAPRSDLVYVLVDPRAFVALDGEAALPDDAVLRRTIALGSERPESIDDGDHLALLRRAGVVFDLDVRAVAAMRRHGVPARTLKPGYSRLRDHYDPDAPRPIDVMFLGAHSLRRTEHLRRCARVFARRNCLLHFSDLSLSPQERPSFLGDGRWSLLAQTKIVLNLHRDERSDFEWLRAVDAIHAGAVVVSEHSSGIGALEPGRHLLVADGDSLPYVVERLLRDEDRLTRMRRDAYERLRSWIPFALPASIFRAAIVEILGRPLHAGVSLGDRSAAPTDDRARERTSAFDAGLAQRLDATHAELIEVRQELVQVRRQAASLRRDLIPGARTELMTRTPAWDARRRPRVSVLVASLEDGPRLARTLDSVAGSWMRDYELVVADAGSTDDSTAIAKHWLLDHPRIPGLLIADRAGRGRGGARNAAIDFARGESILVLDSGAAIYSHCIQRLADTLASMDEVAFVYPMIEVSTDSEWFVRAGGDNLLNVFAWEPERLRSGNFIHTPYLIRSSALRELGGFTSNPGLDGFEDYDLWCRIAERGSRGQLVAQLLAWRVELPGSTCLPTLHPAEGPATRALMSHAPRAMAGAFAR